MENKKIIKLKLHIIIIALILLSLTVILVLKSTNQIISSTTNNINKDLEISEIKIRYAYTYNVSTAETLNAINKNGNFINILEINLDGQNLTKINNMIHDKDLKRITDLQLMVIDTYEMTINNKVKLSIQPEQEKYAYYSNGKDNYIVELPEGLVNEVHTIVQKEANKHIKQLTGENITISLENNKDVSIVDKSMLKTFNNSLKYVEIKPDFDYEDDYGEIVAYTIDLDSKYQIGIYHNAGSLGYIINKNTNDKKYISFMNNFESIVSDLYKQLLNIDNTEPNDKIILQSVKSTDSLCESKVIMENGDIYEVSYNSNQYSGIKLNELINNSNISKKIGTVAEKDLNTLKTYILKLDQFYNVILDNNSNIDAETLIIYCYVGEDYSSKIRIYSNIKYTPSTDTKTIPSEFITLAKKYII